MDTKLKNGTLAFAAALAMGVGFAGCEKNETAGDKLDNAIDATSDAVEDAADATGDAVDDAVDATGDAVDDAADAVEDAADGG